MDFSAAVGNYLPPPSSHQGVRWYIPNEKLPGRARDFVIKFGVPKDIRLPYFRKFGPILWELRPDVDCILKSGDYIYARDSPSSGGRNAWGAYLPSEIDAILVEGLFGTITHNLGNTVRLRNGDEVYQIAEVLKSLQPEVGPRNIFTFSGRQVKSVRLRNITDPRAALDAVVGPTASSTNTLRCNLVSETVKPNEALLVAHLGVVRNANQRVIDGAPGTIVHPLDALATLRDARAALAAQEALYGN